MSQALEKGTVEDGVNLNDAAELAIPDNGALQPAAVKQEEESESKWYFYDGDIVVKRVQPVGWDYVPWFGTVLRQRTQNPAVESENTGFNVRWELNNVVEMVEPDQVSLVDRLLLRNTKVENVEGTAGTVTDWSVTTSVQLIGTHYVVEKVALDRLRPISSFIRGQEIMYQEWVGVITCVKRNIWFALDGGMSFYVPVTEKDGFIRNDPYWGIGMPCPGIRTKLTSSFMRNAKWTSGPMKFFSKIIPPLSYLYSMANVTLTKSEVTEVVVQWLGIVPTSDPESSRPSTNLNREDLKSCIVIGMPSTETVGFNSVRMLKLRPEDFITNYTEWKNAFQKKYVEGDETVEPQRSPISSTAALKTLATERIYEVPVKVLSRQTSLDVSWNDGSVEKVYSTKIPKLLQVKEDTEFPNGMVVAPVYTSHDLAEYYGVVVDSEDFVKSKSRKVNVMWLLNGNVIETRAEPIFNLKPHPTYSMYERGTIVFPRVAGSTKFISGVVCDLNVAQGKLVITVTADHSQHEVYPHLLVPMSRRCFWNFFTQQWTLDEIIIPPYQLQVEFGPEQKYVEVAEPSPDILTNNNPDDLLTKSVWDEPVFEMLAFAPETHRYYKSAPVAEKFGKPFMEMMSKEIASLKKHGTIPDGIWIRCYENRLDLVSILMVGPSETPYEDGVFIFDAQLPADFPAQHPKVHYVSYSYEVNPYLSWDGNVCVSALVEPKLEALDDCFIVNYAKQIQALIFSPEPLLSGPREFIKPNNPRIAEHSKFYNEFVLMRVLDSTWNMIHRPFEPWTDLIKCHFASVLPEKLAGYDNWHLTSDIPGEQCLETSFPLFPVSEGFREAFTARIQKLKKITPHINLSFMPRTYRIKDITADSESVPVDTPRKKTPVELDISLELVEPKSQNANDQILEKLSTSSSGKTSPPTTPPKSPETLDSEKNIVKGKGKKKSKDKKKVKKEKNSKSSGLSSASSASASEPEEESVKTDDEKELATLPQLTTTP